MMPKFQRLVAGMIAVALLLGNKFAFACSLCKDALANSPEGQQLARGMNAGILFLLAIPFFIVGTIALRILRANHQKTIL